MLFFKSDAENEGGGLVPDPFLLFKFIWGKSEWPVA